MAPACRRYQTTSNGIDRSRSSEKKRREEKRKKEKDGQSPLRTTLIINNLSNQSGIRRVTLVFVSSSFAYPIARSRPDQQDNSGNLYEAMRTI